MGSEAFTDIIVGKDLAEEFRRLVDEDLYEYGHDAYSGTFGQMDRIVEFSLLRGAKLPRASTRTIEDRWSPDGTRVIRQSTLDKLEGILWQAEYDPDAYQRLGNLIGERQAERLVELTRKWSRTMAAINITGTTAAKKAKKARGREGTRDNVWIVYGTAST